MLVKTAGPGLASHRHSLSAQAIHSFPMSAIILEAVIG